MPTKPPLPTIIGMLFALLCVSLAQNIRAQETPSWLRDNVLLDASGAWHASATQLLRFAVRDEAVYRIDRAWLLRAGVDVQALAPQRLALFVLGKEIPLLRVGLDDGSFDEGDALLFYADAPRSSNWRRIADKNDRYAEYRYPFSDSTVCWLAVGTADAMPLPHIPTVAGVSDTLRRVYRIVHLENNETLQFLGTNADDLNSWQWSGEKTWLWALLSRTRSFPIDATIPEVVPDAPAHLLFRLAGYQGTPSQQPNHRVMVEVQGLGEVDTTSFNLGDQVLLEVSLPPDALRAGTKRITLHSRPEVDARSTVALDWLDVDVPVALRANAGQWLHRFNERDATGVHALRVSGFSSSTLRAIRHKEGNWSSLNVSAELQSDGSYTAVLSDTLAPGVLIAISDNATFAPDAIISSLPALRGESRGAAALLLTADSLRATAEEYAALLRELHGVSTRVVGMRDVYDAFSHGMPEPEALRAFIFHARNNWSDTLRSVLLLGDANVNPLATSGAYRSTLVPSLGWPASDAALVSFDSAGVEQGVDIGRLPVRSAGDIRAAIERRRAYSSAAFDVWNKTTLHFSGGEYYENDTQLEFYRSINRQVIENAVLPAPFGGRAAHVYKTAFPASDIGPLTQREYDELIARGALAISYVGHSATTTWDNGIDNPAQLRSSHGRPSLITDFGCSSARFAEPDIRSFGELAVTGGDAPAIAYIGNAGFGARSTGVLFPRLFYDELLTHPGRSLGEAHRRSRKRLLDELGTLPAVRNAVTMSTLLGDPLQRLAIAAQADLVVEENGLEIHDLPLTDTRDSMYTDILVRNFGRAVQQDMTVRILLLASGDTLALREWRGPVPLFESRIPVVLPLPGVVGDYMLRCIVDAENEIAELREDNNIAQRTVLVVGGRFAVVNAGERWTAANPASLRLLNPGIGSNDFAGVRYESDIDPQFSTPITQVGAVGHIISRPDAAALFPAPAPRHWRASSVGDTGWTSVRRAVAAQRGSALLMDSLDWHGATLERLVVTDSGLALPGGDRHVRILCGGPMAGAFASVEVDGIEALPRRNFDGYGVVVLDRTRFTILDARIFSTVTSAAEADSLREFLLAHGSGVLLAVAAAGDPTVHRDRFAAALRSFGSSLIDSVEERGSFACIGERSASPGSIPERRAARLGGAVTIDTSYAGLPPNGRASTPWLGPMTAWSTVELDGTDLDANRCELRIVARTRTGVEDTLVTTAYSGSIDLSTVNAAMHPWLRCDLTLRAAESMASPRVRSLRFGATWAPELAMNDQSVSFIRDSVRAGEPLDLRIGVVNAGEGGSTPTRIGLELRLPGAAQPWLGELALPPLAFDQRFDTTLRLPAAIAPGSGTVLLRIDPDDFVPEQEERNNSIVLPFHVEGDTTAPVLELLADGRPLRDGDVVRPTPTLRFVLTPASGAPVTDASRFSIRLDDVTISTTDERVQFEPGSANDPAILLFEPTLETGEHVLEYNARDMLGNAAFVEARQLRVFVDRDARILDALPWPNPFTDATTITFTLTGDDAPANGSVQVYTVAGRAVRHIPLVAGTLRVGFNTVLWDGKDEEGDDVANGVYFYKLRIAAAGGDIEHIGRVLRQR
ncbi:MAG TPA: C25 family cysteine peptidase [Bacteroidota bacterium]|nr:C25 family cysteine peptidase [Bacteroidota bacterium]